MDGGVRGKSGAGADTCRRPADDALSASVAEIPPRWPAGRRRRTAARPRRAHRRAGDLVEEFNQVREALGFEGIPRHLLECDRASNSR